MWPVERYLFHFDIPRINWICLLQVYVAAVLDWKTNVRMLQVTLHLSKFIMKLTTIGLLLSKNTFLQTILVQWKFWEGKFISFSTNFRLTAGLESHQMKCIKYL